MSVPVAVRVRMYQVGFGDCFLLTFEYPVGSDPRERHLLLDFGRNTRPHAGGDMKAVAEDIRARTNRRLDVVVVTHRHEHHLSAFGSSTVAPIIEDCDPRLVVRSWTEDPKAPEVAPGQSLAAADRRAIAALEAGQALGQEISESRFALERTVVGRRLHAFAFDQVRNKAAIDRLDTWAGDSRGVYLSFGSDRLRNVLPGVDIEVLGPPTAAQYPAIAGEADKDPEYWLALRRRLPAALELAAADDGSAGAGVSDTMGDDDAARPPERPTDLGHASDAPAPGEIGPVRWLTEKLRRQQVASLLRIVRSLDQWLNNTSLILLVRAGERRILLPGDAQLENWRYALKDLPDASERERIRADLALVDLYKVGHHGSRNATPRSLYRLWAPIGKPDRAVVSLMSTREDVYGESYATEVPHPKLTAALGRAPRRLISTLQDPDAPDPSVFREVWAPTSGAGVFEEA